MRIAHCAEDNECIFTANRSDPDKLSDQPLNLQVFCHVPEGLLSTSGSRIADVLTGPTLFDLPGRTDRPLFVSTLLHGNEQSGLLAVQHILRRYAPGRLPRRLILFIGNVRAAKAGVRTLETQHDYNRCWPGTRHPDTLEAQLMRSVFDYVAARQPVASIDVHNTTGRNPKFSVVDRLDDRFLGLASRFSDHVILCDKSFGIQQQAMARICPAVTIECGQSGTPGIEMPAVEMIEACLCESDPSSLQVPHRELTILRDFVAVTVPRRLSISFDGSEADIRFRGDIDLLNFQTVRKHTHLAETSLAGDDLLQVEPLSDDAPPNYFNYTDGKITLASPAIPTMFSLDIRAVELDCLCHFVRSIDQDGRIVPTDGLLDVTRDRD